MWSIYKGLETTIGLNDTTAITNLLTSCGTQDAGDVCNWFEDYAEWLVQNQSVGGSWGGYSSWNSALATPWFINILAATRIPDGGDMPGTGDHSTGRSGADRPGRKPSPQEPADGSDCNLTGGP
jgi:hypothetical protein